MKFGTREQYHKKINKKMYGKDDCPFCMIEERKEHIVWKGKHWYIIHNLYPYTGNHLHLMAVPYKHKKYFLELTDEEIIEIKDIHIFIKEFYGKDSYFSCTRETMENRSIEHYHQHFLPGKLQGKYLRNMLMNQGFPIEEHL